MTAEQSPTDEKDNDREKKGKPFDGDSPIIVGGGGSTWVWIPNLAGNVRYDNASTIPPQNLPDADTMPPQGQLRDYMAVYLPNFTVRNINPHDGRTDHGDKPVQDARNHRTKFKSV